MEDITIKLLKQYFFNRKVKLFLYPEESDSETFVEGFVEDIYTVNLGYCVDTRVKIDSKEFTINRDRTFITLNEKKEKG
ncbi:MAG TPA: hypothetical protein PLP33_25320 [Leptospiraceae bacterium]|nr:hypothetical protein [Leptospiraceae bacterium]